MHCLMEKRNLLILNGSLQYEEQLVKDLFEKTLVEVAGNSHPFWSYDCRSANLEQGP